MRYNAVAANPIYLPNAGAAIPNRAAAF